MTTDQLIGSFLVAVGAISFLGAIFNLASFRAHRKVQSVEKWVGERGVRPFYVVIGGIVMAVGWLLLLGYFSIRFKPWF